MPLNFRPQFTPASWSLPGVLSLLVLSTVLPAFGAESVASLAQREAAKRQMRVDSAGADLRTASNLMAEGKTEEAVRLLESIYSTLPDAPLTEEIKVVARGGYVSAGCIRAEELMAVGKRDEADALLAKLLTVSRNDKQVLDCQKRLADPDRYPPALTAEHVENVGKVQSLLLKANSALEIGDYDLATRIYQDVLRVDKANSAARRGMERVERLRRAYFEAAYDQKRASMLAGVDRLWEDPVPPTTTDLNALFGARERASAIVGSGRDSILEKLRNYRMPRVEFQAATLPEVIELLRLRSRDLDPEGRGIDFVINMPEDVGQAQISLTLSDVPMEEVLRYVTESAGASYRVEPRAVVIGSLSEKNSAMITRSYRVPPDFIQNSPAAAAAPGGAADPFAPNALPAGGGLVLRRVGAKEFLEGRGVQFPEGSSASFSGASSTLVVRNTASNIELVERMVEMAAQSSPRMAVITVRMLEVSQTNLDELGFDWLVGGVGFNGNNVFAGGGSSGNGVPFSPTNYPFANTATIPAITNGAGTQLFPSQPVASAVGGSIPIGALSVNGGGGGSITAGNRSGGYAAGANSLDSLLGTGNANPRNAPAPGVLSIAGVFTDPQFQTVMRGLAQKKGVDINSSPSVTTKSGVKAIVEVTREFIYPTEFDPPQLPPPPTNGGIVFVGGNGPAAIATPTTPTAFETRKTGTILEVEPVISDDGQSVEVVITPDITDFEGFIDYGTPIYQPASNSFLPVQIAQTVANAAPTISWVPLTNGESLVTPNRILQPVFKQSKVSTSVKIWDGATVMLGGLKFQEHTIVDDSVPILGDLPFLGRLFQTHVKRSQTKNVIIFVTVDLIDPSGQKLRKNQTASVAP